MTLQCATETGVSIIFHFKGVDPSMEILSVPETDSECITATTGVLLY